MRAAMPDSVSDPSPPGSKRQIARDLVISLLSLVSVGIGLYRFEGRGFGALEILDLAIVLVFWVDFVHEARRVGAREYLRTHWWELPSLVPALPLARVLRLLRLLRVIGVLIRLRPVGSYVMRLARRARIDAIFGVGAVVVFVGTLLAHWLESTQNPKLATLGDATWFSFNMFTNVAYLDFQPVTTGGRILAGILQLCGIAFIGVFTASLAGAIIKEPGPPKEE